MQGLELKIKGFWGGSCKELTTSKSERKLIENEENSITRIQQYLKMARIELKNNTKIIENESKVIEDKKY